MSIFGQGIEILSYRDIYGPRCLKLPRFFLFFYIFAIQRTEQKDTLQSPKYHFLSLFVSVSDVFYRSLLYLHILFPSLLYTTSRTQIGSSQSTFR